jgi:NAD(P)-dependent dehydrogenase (short-subunit alcohol dehydrogenase family)
MSPATSGSGSLDGLFDLTGSVALVTGGNGGVGLAMASGLASAGATVCVWGTNAAKNAAAAEQLEAHGGVVHTQVVDVAAEDEVVAGFATVVERFGHIDTCFANAAATTHRDAPRFVDSTLEEWHRFWRVNLDGTFLALREAARHMIRQGTGGSLVATSSIAAHIAAPRDEAYAATKAAVTATMRGLAAELGRYGIRCNTVTPGWTRSPAADHWMANDAVAEGILRRMPLRRWGEAEDWAGIAVYLASRASAFHTADDFRIDGGFAAT